MKKLYYYFISIVVFNTTSIAQLKIDFGTTDYTIDFDTTLSGVNEAQFTGKGFTPVPAAGQLNSNAWEVTGASDSILTYGDSLTTGDFARGTSSGNVTTGGIYSFLVTPTNSTLGFQPSTADFTPGNMTLRVLNNTLGSITAISISYNIYMRNDQDRATSLKFSYSYDNVNYFSASSFDFTSTEIADPIPSWNLTNKFGIITGFNIKSGAYIYLRWTTDDVSGTGSRDELAIDDITLNATVTTSTIVHLVNTSLTANESLGTFQINLAIQNPSAIPTSVDLVLINQSQYSADVSNFSSQTIIFPSNDGDDQSVSITITDDTFYEGVEDLFFILSNAAGGNSAFIGIPDTFHLTILDNELVNIVINEFLADPDPDSGDANGDGAIGITEDEFIEFVNNELFSIDISGWTISDSVQVRHTFSSGTILTPGNVITVFGGGTPTGIPGLVQTAAPFGGLGLNNDSDSIIIKNLNNMVVVCLGYGNAAGQDQSLARDPDVTGSFVQHTTISTNPVQYSPGRFNTDGSPLPVELISFSAIANLNSVKLIWTTATEVNNYGFDIERFRVVNSSTARIDNNSAEWQKIGFVNGSGNSNSPKSYSFTDDIVSSGNSYYRLKQIDNDGKFDFSEILEVLFNNPKAFDLEQNYPNPFNPTTKIRYSIPTSTIFSEEEALGTLHVTLKVFDVLGNEVVKLVDEQQQPGSYEIEFDASRHIGNKSANGGYLSSGVYYYQLRAGSFVETKKMILLR